MPELNLDFVLEYMAKSALAAATQELESLVACFVRLGMPQEINGLVFMVVVVMALHRLGFPSTILSYIKAYLLAVSMDFHYWVAHEGLFVIHQHD